MEHAVFRCLSVPATVPEKGGGLMADRGSPRVKVTAEEVATLKAQGLSFREIARSWGSGSQPLICW